jgi:Ni,Fe-hydrogenase maturation factor
MGNLLWADEGFGVRATEVLIVSRRHFSILAQRGRVT